MYTSDKKFVPVMITPFNLKAKVDLDTVSLLVDFYLAAGVKGFFANCLSSEMYSLSEDERLELTTHFAEAELVRNQVGKRGEACLAFLNVQARRVDSAVRVVVVVGAFDRDDAVVREFLLEQQVDGAWYLAQPLLVH